MPITELPPFTPRLEEFRAEEFLAHSLTLLEYPIEQDQEDKYIEECRHEYFIIRNAIP